MNKKKKIVLLGSMGFSYLLGLVNGAMAANISINAVIWGIGLSAFVFLAGILHLWKR